MDSPLPAPASPPSPALSSATERLPEAIAPASSPSPATERLPDAIVGALPQVASPAESAASSAASVLVGRILQDRYRIDVVLGEGGMGAVYKAEHLLMHKRVAIKVLHPELTRVPEVVARFEREAMAAAHIDHPNVAAATDFGKLSDGSFFLVLEFVEGKSLRELIAQGPVAPARAIAVTRQVLAALARAHSLGIVHRDLKPENVMLVPRDERDELVKVLDFGIAKVPMGDLVQAGDAPRREPLTQQGMVYGTPEYMAPEQALGEEVDARADLYSVGVLLFEMLTGRRPFDAPNKVQILGMVVSKPVPSFRETLPEHTAPASLEAFTRKLLAKTPGGRFADAKEALEALEAVSLVEAPRAEPSLAAAVAPPRQSLLASIPASSRGMLFAAAGGLVLAGVIVLVLLGRREEPPAPTTPGKLVATAAPATEAQKTTATDEEITAAADLAAAEALAKRYPADPKSALNVVRAAFVGKQYARAVQELDALSAKNPRAASSPEIRTGLREAAAGPAADEAFVLIASPKLGPDGPDVLYDLASNKDTPVAAQKRAEGLLAEQAVRERASPALRVALDLRATATMAKKPACEARAKLLPVAKEQGDARAAAFVKPLTVPRCGYFHNQSCHPCLAKSDLPGTLAALESRPWQ